MVIYALDPTRTASRAMCGVDGIPGGCWWVDRLVEVRWRTSSGPWPTVLQSVTRVLSGRPRLQHSTKTDSCFSLVAHAVHCRPLLRTTSSERLMVRTVEVYGYGTVMYCGARYSVRYPAGPAAHACHRQAWAPRIACNALPPTYEGLTQSQQLVISASRRWRRDLSNAATVILECR